MESTMKKGLSIVLACAAAFLLAGCGSKASIQATEAATAAGLETSAAQVTVMPEVEDTGWAAAYQEILLSDYYQGCYMYLYQEEGTDIPELLIGVLKPGYTSMIMPVNWNPETQKASEDSDTIKSIAKNLQGEFPDQAFGLIMPITEFLDNGGQTAVTAGMYDIFQREGQYYDLTGDDYSYKGELPFIPWRPINKENVEQYVTSSFLTQNTRDVFYIDSDTDRLRYRLENGEDAKSTWITDCFGLSRYIDEDGYVKLGWHEENGKEYFLDPNPDASSFRRLEGIKLTDGTYSTYLMEDYKEWSASLEGKDLVAKIEENGIPYYFDKDGVAQKNKFVPLNLDEFEMIDPKGKFRFWVKSVEKRDGYYEATGALEALSFSQEWINNIEIGSDVVIPLWKLRGYDNQSKGIQPSIVKCIGKTARREPFYMNFDTGEAANSLTKESSKADWIDALTIPCTQISQKVDGNTICLDNFYYNYIDKEFDGYSDTIPGGIALYEDVTLIFDEHSIELYPEALLSNLYGFYSRGPEYEAFYSSFMEEYEKLAEVKTCSPDEDFPLFDQRFYDIKKFMVYYSDYYGINDYGLDAAEKMESHLSDYDYFSYSINGEDYLYRPLDITLTEGNNHVTEAEWSTVVIDALYIGGW